MIEFLIGALAMLVVLTFAPPQLAAMPSKWLRDVWARLKDAVRRPRE